MTLRFGVAAMVMLAPILLPGRHYLLYPICIMLISYLGRFVGVVRYDRGIAESPEFVGLLLAIAVAIMLGVTVYWAWSLRDPLFMVLSFNDAVTLSFCVGRDWARVAMGLLDIVLLVGALVFYFEFPRAGFLAVAAYAGLVVWHFLFRKNQRPTPALPAESLRT